MGGVHLKVLDSHAQGSDHPRHTHTHTHMAGEVLRTVKCELVTLVEPFHERQPLVCRNIIVLYAYTSTCITTFSYHSCILIVML